MLSNSLGTQMSTLCEKTEFLISCMIHISSRVLVTILKISLLFCAYNVPKKLLDRRIFSARFGNRNKTVVHHCV